jgi:TonB family protein
MRLMIVVWLAAAGSLLAQDPVDARGWINRGVQEFQAAHYPEAVAAFQKAVAADPSFVTARLYLATAWMQQFVPGVDAPENRALAASADREFRRVLDFDPENKVALSSLGGLSLSQKHWDAAEQWFEKLVQLDPADTNAWYSMGWLAWAQWHPAYLEARRIIGMKPQEPGPMTAGRVKEDLKKQFGGVLETGIEALRHGLLIDPKFGDAMTYLNKMIRERADLRDTEEEYRQDLAEADGWAQKANVSKGSRTEIPLPGGSRITVTQGMVGAPPEVEPHRMTVAGDVSIINLVERKDPVYPAEAKKRGIEGVVHLAVTIGKDGHVTGVKLINGPDPLIQAAIDAVKQWVYEPTLFNGIPVEIETVVDVGFSVK